MHIPPALTRVTFLSGLLVSLAGCPAVTSPPCSTDTDCTTGQCRLGACAPSCSADGDCGTLQVCREGSCVPRPQCSADEDCASGFACLQGSCRCTADTACAANQACFQGSCQARARCKTDGDCTASGGRCELTLGVCTPPCALPTDCAPGVDPRVATALYQCSEGACRVRCLNDATCGAGLVCQDGLCGLAECKTLTDCPAQQYCSSAVSGRCREYQACSLGSTGCAANFECRAFGPGQCPPGFPCGQALCRELPLCLIDSECHLPGRPPAFCDQGHCQPTDSCAQGQACGPSQQCIAELCVPASCRGLTDCSTGQACVGGACELAPAPDQINALSLTPRTGLLEVGDHLKLTLVAYRLDGSSHPLPSAQFAVVDLQGNPSGLATVDPSGVVTAVGAGEIRVRASVTGANVPYRECALRLYPSVTSGRRVLVLAGSTGAPLAGAVVRGCDHPPASGPCPAPVDVLTDATGVAMFSAFSGPSATFTVASLQLRSDGLPRFERVTVLGATGKDLMLSLAENPVHGDAGFNGAISFANVQSSGTYWAGLAALSASDLPSVDLRTLLGDTFQVTLPGVGQKIPVPGSVVLYTSPGLGIPQELKGHADGLGEAGLRRSVGFAGRMSLSRVLGLRSVEFLSYVGAMDFAIQSPLSISARPWVEDTNDLDGDGLCAQPSLCPSGSESLPDYAHFTSLSIAPQRSQARRTEVVLPSLAPGLDTVIVTAIEDSEETGALPVGFSSRTAGAVAANGTRAVAPLLLRSGAPYGGAEVSRPGIWAWATTLTPGSSGFSVSANVSARITRADALPSRVVVAPFLPFAEASGYAPSSRVFSPAQPAWNALASAGAGLARLELTGTEGRHRVYFALTGAQTSVDVPEGPLAPGVDPAGEASVRAVVVGLELSAGVTLDDAFSLAGPALAKPSAPIDGYSRFQAQVF